MRFGDRIAHFGARRIDDADHAAPDQMGFDRLGLLGDVGDLTGGVRADARDLRERIGLERAERLAERTVCLTRQALDGVEDVLAVAFGELANRAVHVDAVAVAQQHVRRALREHGELAGVSRVARDDGHALAFGRERDFGHAVEVRELLVRVRLAGGHDERDLGRIAHDLPRAGLLTGAQFAVVRERARAERREDFVRHVLGDRGAVDGDHVAFRRIAGAGQFDFARRHDHAFDGHLVARERTGLVGADHRSGAQCLHRVQLLDDRVVGGHALHAEREHHGQDRSEAFRNGRDGERHGEQQRIDHVVHAVEAFEDRKREQHDHGDDAHGDAEDLGDVVHLLLQRRGLVFGGLEQVGNLAHLRVHAGAGHDGAAGALRHGRAVEHHVRAVAERLRAVERGGLLAHRHRFAGERRLGDAQARGGEQSAVGRHGVAFAKHQDVTGHDVGRVDAFHTAVAQHVGRGCGHFGKRVDGLFRLRFLHIAQDGIDDQDQHDHDGVERQRLAFGARRRVHLFDDPRHKRDGGGGEQQVDKRVLELLQELLPLGDRRCAGQLIGAELVESAFGFVGTQAGARVYIERLRHLIGIGERRIDVVQQSLLRLHLLGFLGILWFHVGFAGKSGWIYDAIIHSCCSPRSAAE